MRRQRKRPVVQLTSLLDLLFVMIFVSLLQTKAPKAQDKPEPKPRPAPVAKKAPKPVAKPEPVRPKPKPRIANISGTFHFYPTSRSQYKFTGKYRMNGVFDRENQKIQLGGVGWIDKPAGIDINMVPISGQINSDGSFTGRVEDPDCQSFTLRKVMSGQGVEVAGSYEGTYVCAQGETGLTLTIQ